MLVAFHCTAQELLEDLRLSRLAYQNLEHYHGRMLTKVYGTDAPEKVSHTTELIVRKKGQQFHYATGPIEMLMNTRFLINLNKEQNLLVCNRVNTEEFLNNPIAIDLENLIQDFSEIKYKGETGKSKCYILRSDQHLIELVELYFNRTNYLLDKVVYHYSKAYKPEFVRMEMTCEHIDFNPDFQDELFSERQFVRVEGKKVSRRKKYEDYTLIVGNGLESVE